MTRSRTIGGALALAAIAFPGAALARPADVRVLSSKLEPVFASITNVPQVTIAPGSAPVAVSAAPARPASAQLNFMAGMGCGGQSWTVPAGKDLVISYLSASGAGGDADVDGANEGVEIVLRAFAASNALEGEFVYRAERLPRSGATDGLTVTEAVTAVATGRVSVSACPSHFFTSDFSWSATVVGTLVDE